jgi:hypothetical protein
MLDLYMVGLLAAAGMGAWFWLDSMRAREIATGLCRHVCQQQQLQFLDDTVALNVMGLARNAQGRIQIRRIYRFEYSDDGVQRHQGEAVMLGAQLTAIKLPRMGEGHRPT